MATRARRLWIWLTSIVVIAVFLWLAVGWGPVWERRLEGQVVDARTGKGVPNAEVFATYEMRTPTSAWAHHTRWVTTDADGRFVLPGALSIRPVPLACTSDLPSILAVHPAYGARSLHFRRPGDFPGWRNMRIEIRPGEFLDVIRESDRPTAVLCAGMTNEGCWRVVELLCDQMKPDACGRERQAFRSAEIDRQRARERGWR